MAVSILTNRVVANGNDVATVFSFSDIVISKSSDLVVVKRDIAGNETTLAEGSSSTTYSVSVSAYPGTGSITYPAVGGTPLATGEKLAMRSVRDITQDVDLENQGGYFPDVQEGAFDKLTYICQQQQDELDRSLKIPTTDTTTTLDTLQAALLVVAGISANITTVAGISADVTTVAGLSADITTIIGISSEISTVAGVASDVSSVASQSFKFLFDDATAMADPGTGEIRYNNATPASVTNIAISNTFSGGADISPFIVTWDDSANAANGRATLVLRKGGSGTVFQVFKVTGAITDNGAWLQIPVAHIAGTTLPAAADSLFIVPVLNGADSVSDKISDADGDTRVETENAPDEDVIRFYTAGTQRGSWNVTGLSLAVGNRVNEFSIDGTLAGNSDLAVPTEKAVKTYADGLTASQAQQEAGTETAKYVTPSVAQFHPSAAKGWVLFDMTDDVIDVSYNITSLANSATGATTINWATDFSSSVYGCLGSSMSASSSKVNFDTQSAGAIRALNYNDSSVLADALIFVAGFGDQ